MVLDAVDAAGCLFYLVHFDGRACQIRTWSMSQHIPIALIIVSIPRQRRGLSNCEPLKAAKRGRKRGPNPWCHRFGGRSSAQPKLLQSFTFLLPMASVVANHTRIPPTRRYEIPSGPEMLAYEVPLLSIHSRQINGTFAHDVAHHMRYRIFWRYRGHCLNMIDHQMPFANPTFLVLRQVRNTSPKVFS